MSEENPRTATKLSEIVVYRRVRFGQVVVTNSELPRLYQGMSLETQGSPSEIIYLDYQGTGYAALPFV